MKIQLKRSGILQSGFAKEPTAEQLEHGELAVNFNATDPSIFIKNSDNAVVKISGAGSAGSFDGDYNSLTNKPTIGNGNINISAGNGLTASGDNATANQTGTTTRTLTAKAGNSTILVDSNGIKVQNANITPDWNNIQNKPGTVGGAALSSGSYLSGGPYDGSAAKTFNVDAATTATANKIVARDGNGDTYGRYIYGQYMNMSHDRSTRSSDSVFYSSTDDFIRKTDATGMRASLNVPTRTGGSASGTWSINITGSAGSASSSTNATNSTNVRVDHDTGNAWHRPTFVTDSQGSGSNLRLYTDNASTIAINPSSNQIRATTFVGDLSGNVRVDHDTGNAWHRPTFISDSQSSGSTQRLYTDSASTIGINPSSNQIRATTFVGALSGNATSSSSCSGNAATATNATNATNFNVSADNSTNSSHYMIFTGGASGNQRPNSDNALTYNPSTNTLNAGTFNSTSDIKLKKDIIPINNALSRISNINGVNFTWKDSGLQTVGVIAQNVEEEFPELVSTDDIKSVNYNGLVGVLIEAVKELQAEVSQLKEVIKMN